MIAVIIPAYNRPDCLRRALDSLVQQTEKRFLTIVVDDNSEEDLLSVCDSYFDKLKIYYLKNSENLGPGASRQKGIYSAYLSHIDFVTFLDSDDVLYPDAISRLGYEIQHRGDDMVTSPISVQQKIGPSFVIDAEKAATVWMHGKIFRTKFLIENEIEFPKGLRGNEDLSFCVKCFYSTEKKSMINSPVYLWMDEKNSITREKGSARDNVLSLDYIRASYYAIKYLVEKNINIIQLFPRVFFCYNYYQFAASKGMEISEEIDNMINYILNIPLFKKELTNINSLNELKDKVYQYMVVDKIVYPFKETFFDWIKRLGVSIE